MFLENWSDIVHKSGHVALRALPTSCTLNRDHTMFIQDVEVAATESTTHVKLIIWIRKRLENQCLGTATIATQLILKDPKQGVEKCQTDFICI